ncbi:peptidylprolyl isomerase [Reichenbachiella sp. MALMAid0571]|uniref:peptidylprolyl isomerase n=1 Tax=Reichenbachiella sp. MALMAid0571 TaxID=3143939 RepID=UPI0032DF30D5
MNLRYIKIKTFLTSILIILTLGSSMAQTEQGVLIDKIVAKVDDYIILKSELEKAYLDFLSRGQVSQGNAKCQMMETLVINKLMVAKAEIDSVEVTPDQVNQNLEQRISYIVSQIGSVQALEEYYGKTMDQFRQEMFDQIKEQLVVQKMQGEITTDVKVTPAEVKRFFNKIPRDSLPFFSSEVAIAQIVKKPEINKAQKEKVKKQLNEIRDQILAGGSFSDLAKKYSMDPGSGSKGGKLGFFKRGELAPEYEATALSLEPGEISLPVETQFGFHIIQLVERLGNTFNTNHILIIPSSSSTDMDDARKYLDSLRTVINLDSISFEKAAKEYSDDQTTAGSGGFFLDATGASRVSVEELDPVIFFTIDTMQINTITKPMDFRMEDGTDAVRILYYKEKISPHQASLLDDYQKIRSATLASKRNEILSNWFKEAKGDVYIHLEPEYEYCDILKD